MTIGHLPQALRAPVDCPAGAEPWAVRGDRHGVLLLHGLTGSPWEVAPLAQALVAQGRSVAVPLLAGHGTEPRALECTRWADWLASGRAALHWLERHCRRVDIVGFSMGGLVALRLAAELAPVKRGRLVLLAPALAVEPWQEKVLAGLRRIGYAPLLETPNSRLTQALRAPRYDALPIRSVFELLEFQQDVLARPAPVVESTLLIHGLSDRSIPAERTVARAEALFGKSLQVQRIVGAGHMLLTDPSGSERVERVVQFIAQPATGRR